MCPEIQNDATKMGAVNWRSPECLAGERPSLASDIYSFAICNVEILSGAIPWERPMMASQIRFHLKKGLIPYFAASINEKQWNLSQLMIKLDSAKRVMITFVANKLNGFVQDEKALTAIP